MAPFINEQIQKVEGNSKADEGAAQWRTRPLHQGNLQHVPVAPRPLASKDPVMQDLDPINSGEQCGTLDYPQTGVPNDPDPAASIEEKVLERREYSRYRDRYRKAVQREFVRRAHEAGIEPNRDVAEEIKKEEMSTGSQ